MDNVRIKAVREPFDRPYLARKAVAALGRAAAMGLLPADETVDTLDLPTLRRLARHLSRAGIARGPAAELLGEEPGEPAQLDGILSRLDDALLHSPVPDHEWREVGRVLGDELLGRLLGVSSSSLHRYASGRRTTPDDTAERLHFLAIVIGDLAGSYNHVGIRRWFERPRAQLAGRSPAAVLKGDWGADTPGPASVRRLAAALLDSPAT